MIKKKTFAIVFASIFLVIPWVSFAQPTSYEFPVSGTYTTLDPLVNFYALGDDASACGSSALTSVFYISSDSTSDSYVVVSGGSALPDIDYSSVTWGDLFTDIGGTTDGTQNWFVQAMYFSDVISPPLTLTDAYGEASFCDTWSVDFGSYNWYVTTVVATSSLGTSTPDEISALSQLTFVLLTFFVFGFILSIWIWKLFIH